MLKFVRECWSFFAWMKRSTSGWSTRMMPMFAPRRTPPCFTVSVVVLKMFMNDTGPEATPCVEHEARRELARGLARVDEAGRIRDELAPEHDAFHRLVELVALDDVGLGLRDVPDDAAHDVGPLLDGLALRVLKTVALGYDPAGVEPDYFGGGGGARDLKTGGASLRCVRLDNGAHLFLLAFPALVGGARRRSQTVEKIAARTARRQCFVSGTSWLAGRRESPCAAGAVFFRPRANHRPLP